MATKKKTQENPTDQEVKKATIKKPTHAKSRSLKNAGTPCICIKKTKYWYCMKQLPDGSLIQCDGPFKTEEICKTHFCQ